MSDHLSRAKLDQLLEEGERGVSFCSEDGIEIDGKKLIPDATKGFLDFKMSHAFPVVNAYGQALHPNVVSMSHQSLLYQPLNFEHIVVAYDRDRYHNDKFLGSVVAVEFPRAPMGGWRVSRNAEDSPGIRAAASFAKLAQGMGNILGQHLGGRRRYTVSMEVQYPFRDCAFAVALNSGQKPKHETPDDMVEAGWELIPWTEAGDDLLATFSVKKNRIISNWKGRKVVQLMGGIDKPVHYSGVAIVQFGAEQEAQILRMAASRTQDQVESILQPLKNLSEILKKNC